MFDEAILKYKCTPLILRENFNNFVTESTLNICERLKIKNKFLNKNPIEPGEYYQNGNKS